MAKYAILIYEDPNFYATMSPEAWRAVIDAHDAFTKQVSELGGSIEGGAALASTTTATTITGGVTVTDGPFVETKEAFGGFYVVEARDLDHALEIAAPPRRCGPSARGQASRIGVMPAIGCGARAAAGRVPSRGRKIRDRRGSASAPSTRSAKRRPVTLRGEMRMT